MKRNLWYWFAALVVACPGSMCADRTLFEVQYTASDKPGELMYAVTYRLWLPEKVDHIRGVIVHQHGCGTGACQGGATAAHDLHWQALARKWDCALLGPEYHQVDGQECRKWCDPRNGSEQTFLRCLDDFAAKTGHAELKTAPWCLWGHSGGGFWASLMQTMHPERIVAIWCRSGTAITAWEKGEIPKPEIPAAAYRIPVVCNPGIKEKDDKRFAGAWTGSMTMFERYRAEGGLIAFIPDPRSAHECGDSRYLAIPFFDACLSHRLPDKGSDNAALKPADEAAAWVAMPLSDHALPETLASFVVRQASWLPGEKFATAWSEYVKTGAVSDTTPPSPPFDLTAKRQDDGSVVVTWDVHADFESGVRSFTIERDGQPLGQLPEKPIGRYGRPLFQSMSYHDTPSAPLPEMKFIDTTAKPGMNHEYHVRVVNGVELVSEPSSAVSAKP